MKKAKLKWLDEITVLSCPINCQYLMTAHYGEFACCELFKKRHVIVPEEFGGMKKVFYKEKKKLKKKKKPAHLQVPEYIMTLPLDNDGMPLHDQAKLEV